MFVRKKIIGDEKPVTVMGRMILKLKVDEGDNVKSGDTLMIIG